MKRYLLPVLLLSGTLPARLVAAQTETLTVPNFGQVSIYAPANAPTEVVLFISGDGGWNLGVVAMAERLREEGALVAGVDIRPFLKSLDASQGCAYPAGDLEELSRNIQLHMKLPAYRRPVLVGYSSGATLVYAALASAPPETFVGAISLGFCPDLMLQKPLCEMRGLKAAKRTDGHGYDVKPFPALTVPWMVLQGEIDQVCAPAATRAFVTETGASRLFDLPKVGHGFGVPRNWEPEFLEAYRALSDHARRSEAQLVPPPTPVADLPLVEVPAGPGEARDLMAVVLTGDGGWAELDKGVAAALASEGVPAVGWSSLRYYWTPRTPEQAAADLARIIVHYTQSWGTQHVALVGYSFGAAVLPFLVPRLPPDVRDHVVGVTLLGLPDIASFEFHVAEWFGGEPAVESPTLPEVRRMTVPVTCVYGNGERDSACPALRGLGISVVSVGEGHHFSGDYRRLAAIVLGR
jgi:type IV secretory pathway VirJ component